MANLYTCCNFASISKDKFIEDAPRILTKGSNTLTLTPAIFHAFASTPSLLGMYTDVNLQKTNKLALELFIKDQI